MSAIEGWGKVKNQKLLLWRKTVSALQGEMSWTPSTTNMMNIPSNTWHTLQFSVMCISPQIHVMVFFQYKLFRALKCYVHYESLRPAMHQLILLHNPFYTDCLLGSCASELAVGRRY